MQGVSALKGLEGPFLFGAMGPLPAGAAPPRACGAGAQRAVSQNFLHRAQADVSVHCLGARLPL